jgi:hypothetical protein
LEAQDSGRDLLLKNAAIALNVIYLANVLKEHLKILILNREVI